MLKCPLKVLRAGSGDLGLAGKADPFADGVDGSGFGVCGR